MLRRPAERPFGWRSGLLDSFRLSFRVNELRFAFFCTGRARELIVRPIAFLFDKLRANQYIDLPFQGGPFVVRAVNISRQSNKNVAKIFTTFARSDVIFDAPKLFIDLT
jgi:hypothetical protein